MPFANRFRLFSPFRVPAPFLPYLQRGRHGRADNRKYRNLAKAGVNAPAGDTAALAAQYIYAPGGDQSVKNSQHGSAVPPRIKRGATLLHSPRGTGKRPVMICTRVPQRTPLFTSHDIGNFAGFRGQKMNKKKIYGFQIKIYLLSIMPPGLESCFSII